MLRLIRFGLLAVLLAVANLIIPPDVHAQPYFYRWGPTAPDIVCSTDGGTGIITAVFSSQPVEWDLPAESELAYVYDYNGTTSPSGPFALAVSGVGSMDFAALASSSLGTTYPVYFAVTLQTLVDGEQVYSSILRGDCNADGMGTTTITNAVVTPPGDTDAESPALPGPDLVELPSGSVVGAFVTTTPAYYAPRANAETDTVIEAAKTLWVLGVDASGNYYKVVLAGTYLWVPVETMGPNYDEVWNGTPLPTNVVD